MVFDIMNIDEEIKKFNLPEVTSSSMMLDAQGIPNPNGLASYEIFGNPGTAARKTQEAYINLHGMFLHPHVLMVLKRLKREIYKDIVNGEGNFFIKGGELLRVSPKEVIPPGDNTIGTGINWLYENWDKLKFVVKEDDANETKVRKQFIRSLNKEEIFISKVIVIPAALRDVDAHSGTRNIMNEFYSVFIQTSSSIKTISIMMSAYKTTEAHKRIQNTLEQYYNYIYTFLGGNKGFFHKGMMGKSVTYSCRLVLSNYVFNGVTEDDLDCRFDRSIIPLHAVGSIFLPFIMYGLKNIFSDILQNRHFLFDVKSNKRVKLHSNHLDIINEDKLKKRLELFVNSKYSRLDPVQLKTNEHGVKIPLLHIKTESENILGSQEDLEGRETTIKSIKPLTWIELIYMAAYDTVRDKCCYVTRYPIEDQHNMYPTMMTIEPCISNSKITVLGKTYPKFPNLPSKDSISYQEADHLFVDTLRIFSAYLNSLGADFDGDQCSVNSVFTEEANEEARKYIRSVTNLTDIRGGTMRGIPKPAGLTLYNVSR